VSLPRVMVGGPVRDREWSVPIWLNALLALDYPKHLLTLAILVNDSADETEACCEWWAERAMSDGWHAAIVATRDWGCTVDNNARGEYRDYNQFARARDTWTALRTDEEWILSLDSDVQVPADLLLQLVTHACDANVRMLAAVLNNNVPGAAWYHTNVMEFDSDGDLWHCRQAFEDRDEEVRPCALTGACCLHHRSIFDEGHRYEPRDGSVIVDGEDKPFCAGLRLAGIQPHYIPSVRATHWMLPPIETSYLRDPDWHNRLAHYHRSRAIAASPLEIVDGTATG